MSDDKTLMNERLPAPTERPTLSPRERTRQRLTRILAAATPVMGLTVGCFGVVDPVPPPAAACNDSGDLGGTWG